VKSSSGTLLRKLLIYTAFALVLIFSLTSGVYVLIAGDNLSEIELSTMNNQASRVSALIRMYYNDEISYPMLEWIYGTDGQNILEGDIYLYNNRGELVYPRYQADTSKEPSQILVHLALQGQTVTESKFSLFYTSGTMLVGQRIDPNSTRYGVLFLVKSADEISAAVWSLHKSLVVSLCFALLILAWPVLRTVNGITQPIHQMQDVANAMTQGDFSLRARENFTGELGDLAVSLNRLSSRLYLSITDLELERNRLQEILYGLTEGILAVDERGLVTLANPAMLALCERESLPSVKEELIADPGFWKGVKVCMGENVALSCTMRLHQRIVQATLTPLITGKDVNRGAVCVIQDITQAEQLEQTRRDYVANVSHELKTPVTNMRMISETLLDGLVKDPAEIKRYYGTLLREAMRLSRLINDLLELSRLQSGSLSLDKQKVDPNSMIEEIALQYRTMADDVGLDFYLEFPDGPCPDVYTNADRAAQVIVQLLSNAIQYTPEGSVTLSAVYDNQKVYVSVRDTGIGISEEDLPNVFERFYKVDRSHSGGGTGLGLSIAREVISRMKETLTVQSKLGEGSVFTLSLERYEKVSEGAQSHASAEEQPDPA